MLNISSYRHLNNLFTIMEKEVQNFISKFRSARAVLVYFYLNKKKMKNKCKPFEKISKM